MRYREFIEGIRMGARDLAAAPKKQYTVGFEFEVAVKDSYDRDFDADSDSDEDNEPSIEELFDEFAEQWYSGESTFDFEQWFDEFIRYNDGMRTVIDHVEPKYGYVDLEDFVELRSQEDRKRIQQASERYSEANISKAKQFVDLFPDEDSLSKNTEQAKQLIRFVYNDVKNLDKYQSDQEWQDLFDDMSNERLVKNAETALTTVRFIIDQVEGKDYEYYENEFDEERYVYSNKDQTEIIDIEEDINDTEDVLQYFDTDMDELRDVTDDDWQEAENEEMMNAFSDWAESQRNGSSDKINYVKSVLKDIRKPNWKVVEDGTPGVDAEIVTGVMDIEEGIESVRSVFELIGSNEYLFTERATGLHINIGTWNGDEWKSVDWLKFLTVYRADKALEAFERQFNSYAADRLPSIISDLEANSLEAFYDNIDTVNQIVKRLSANKMSAVNLSKLPTLGYIEIRAPGGTDYHQKTRTVINQIQRAVRALEIASNPNAYKNQYVKKLYKALSKEKQAGQPTTPTERFFRHFDIKKYYGNDVLDMLIAVIRSSERIDVQAADKLYTMAVHKQIVSDLKRVGQYTANNGDVGKTIRRALSKYDTNGRVSQTKFMRYILSAFPENAQSTTQTQSQPMTSDKFNDLLDKSVASVRQNRSQN
jgi:hypothetical protein